MTCDRVRRDLTAYLDGDLEGADGSLVRGHLRECAACREVASEEAVLRDRLRQLPPMDPPASLWAGVQAQLAAAEVADAKRPAWRRALARWAPAAPRFAAGTLIAAAAAGALWWRAHRGAHDGADDGADKDAPMIPAKQLATSPAPAPITPSPISPAPVPSGPASDVTADLAGETARVTASYGDAAEELLALATEARRQWSNERKEAFDARTADLRGLVERAPEGRPRQRAWRELIRYLQGAVVRDEIALAGGGR